MNLDDSSPRVLHLIGQLGPGGCELQLAGMLETLSAMGQAANHAVLCFWRDIDKAEGIRQRLLAADIELVFLDKRKELDFGFIKQLRQFIKAEYQRFDVVHAWLMSAGLWGRLALRKLGKRRPATVVSYRSAEPHRWPGGVILDRFLARYSEMYVCNSRGVQRVWMDRLKRDETLLPIIPNGVDASRFDPERTNAVAVRQSLGIAPDAIVITQMGKFKLPKNWPLFLEVAKGLCRRDKRLVFLGVGRGEIRQSMLDALRSEPDLVDRILFPGHRSDVPDILAASDIVLSTSDVEGMPNAILEAMAAGKPVVATKISGSEELVRPGQTGTFFSAGDAAGATEALLELIEDRDRRIRYSDAARKIACEAYSFSAMAEAHCRVYQQALERRWNR